MSTIGTDIDVFYPDSGISESRGVDTINFTINAFCPCAVALTGVAVDSTHVRVTFDKPVLNNPAIVHLDVWQIVPPVGSGPIEVLDLLFALDGNLHVTSILFTTSEHRMLPGYEFRLHHFEAAT